MGKLIRSGFVVAAFVLTMVGMGASASAQEDRNVYVGMGVGPTIGLGGRGTQFKLEQSIGVHVLPVGRHPGLFVGGAVGESFGRGGATIQFGARTGFDTRVFSNRKLSLLVTPMVTVGASVSTFRFDDGNGGTTRNTSGAFNLGFAGEVRLVVAQGRVTAWLRPIGIDLHIHDGAGAQYELLAGASYNF